MGTAQNGMQRSCTPGKDRAVRVELILERVTIEITDRPVTGARDRDPASRLALRAHVGATRRDDAHGAERDAAILHARQRTAQFASR